MTISYMKAKVILTLAEKEKVLDIYFKSIINWNTLSLKPGSIS